MDRGLTADDVARALWRRPWVVLAVAGVVLVLGTAYVMTRPRVWKATSVVRVEPQQTDAQLVQRTVGDVEPRLLSLRQAMLGGPVLGRVVDQLKLMPDLVARRGKEAAIEQLRESIDVKPTWNAFEVTVSANDPKVAANIANLVPTVFAQLTNETRASQAADATKVFDSQVKELQDSVNGWQQKIIAFKVAHIGELPEQMEANMRQLDRLSGEMRARTEQLRAVEARRSDLVLMRNGGDTESGRAQMVVDQLQQQLAAAKTQYTDDHPEVVRLSRELKAARGRVNEADARLGVQREERARATREVGTIQRDIDALGKEAQNYQARLDQTPRWAAELAGLEREYDIAKTKYQSVLGRKVEAEIAQEIESRNAPRLFSLVSPAAPPAVPSKPDRFGGLVVVLVAAIGAGVLSGVMVELRDESIRDERQLRGELPLPVLAIVPAMNGRTERRVLMPATPLRREHKSSDSLN
ncbi:MAG TPA: Wzz/FepE/Etk N-terminal domain-containing protein [Myxococcaceae bacterium]|nr:Wzz/FepE/Etk N-terminal domain-containing protein [Myxococcaceae bacterium]